MTHIDELQRLDDAAHLIDTGRQFANMRYDSKAWLREQLDADAKLKEIHDSARESARQRRIDEIAEIEADLARKQEELVQLDEPEFSYGDAVEDFAQRFIDWIGGEKDE